MAVSIENSDDFEFYSSFFIKDKEK